MSKFIDKIKSLKSTIHNLNSEFDQIRSDHEDRKTTDKENEYRLRRVNKENIPFDVTRCPYRGTRNQSNLFEKTDLNIFIPNLKQNSGEYQSIEYLKKKERPDKVSETRANKIDTGAKYDVIEGRRKLNFDTANQPDFEIQYCKRIPQAECNRKVNPTSNIIQNYLRESTITPNDKIRERRQSASRTCSILNLNINENEDQSTEQIIKNANKTRNENSQSLIESLVQENFSLK